MKKPDKATEESIDRRIEGRRRDSAFQVRLEKLIKRNQRPVKEFLDGLDDVDLASVVAAMVDVRRNGLRAARHLEGDIYEVRADGRGVIYRVLVAPQGKNKRSRNR